jgi:hypothetical protein
MKSYAPEVIADNSGQWAGNGLRFATKEEAEENVANLASRWYLVQDTRVVETNDPVNYAWITGKGLVAVDADGNSGGAKPHMPADSVTL